MGKMGKMGEMGKMGKVDPGGKYVSILHILYNLHINGRLIVLFFLSSINGRGYKPIIDFTPIILFIFEPSENWNGQEMMNDNS